MKKKKKKQKRAPGAGRPKEFDYERVNVGPLRVKKEVKEKWLEICEKAKLPQGKQFERIVEEK